MHFASLNAFGEMIAVVFFCGFSWYHHQPEQVKCIQ